MCGGTIVANDAIVTAAHCGYNYATKKWIRKESISVLHGDFTNPMHWNAVSYPCKHFKRHGFYKPQKNEGFGPYDIALVSIQGYFDPRRASILAPCLPGKYKYGYLIGLGLSNQNAVTAPNQLMEAPMASAKYCGHYNFIPGFLNSTSQLCYSALGQVAGCNGQTGSPLVYKAGKPINFLSA